MNTGRIAQIADRVAAHVIVDEAYVRGLKLQLASDIRVLEGSIGNPEDAERASQKANEVSRKWEYVFYSVLLGKEMAELSSSSDRDKETTQAKKLRGSAWSLVLSFGDIGHHLAEWPKSWSKYRNDFAREKKYVFDRIKRAAREAYEDAVMWVQSKPEDEKTFDLAERVTVGNFVLVPCGGLREEDMRRAVDVMKESYSLVSRAGFNKALKRMVVEVSFLSKRGLTAGEYYPNEDKMAIYPIGVFAETVVHEIGHRNWYTVLTQRGRSYWEAAFSGDLTEITKEDVEDIIVRAFKSKEGGDSLPSSIRAAIAGYVVGHRDDPVASYKGAFFSHNLHHHDDFDFWAKTWRDDLVGQKVMRNYVTDYANTSPVEAYAEVFKEYVYHRKLPDIVLHWFRQVS
jgi:hypothetical protein